MARPVRVRSRADTLQNPFNLSRANSFTRLRSSTSISLASLLSASCRPGGVRLLSLLRLNLHFSLKASSLSLGSLTFSKPLIQPLDLLRVAQPCSISVSLFRSRSQLLSTRWSSVNSRSPHHVSFLLPFILPHPTLVYTTFLEIIFVKLL